MPISLFCIFKISIVEMHFGTKKTEEKQLNKKDMRVKSVTHLCITIRAVTLMCGIGCHSKAQLLIKNSCCSQTCETTKRKKSNLELHVFFKKCPSAHLFTATA